MSMDSALGEQIWDEQQCDSDTTALLSEEEEQGPPSKEKNSEKRSDINGRLQEEERRRTGGGGDPSERQPQEEEEEPARLLSEAVCCRTTCCRGGRALKLLAPILKGWVKDEVIALVRLAFPVFIMVFLQQTLTTISIVSAGHIKSDAGNSSLNLDAVALGISYYNVTGVSVGIGLATGANTLCSQAYGFKNYKKVGTFFQRGVLVLGLALFPVWALWLNSESVFLLLQQDPCVSRLAADYIQIQCLTIPFVFLSSVMAAYLQAQSIVWVFCLTMFLANIVNACFLGIFVFWLDLAVVGVAVSLLLTNIALDVILVVYVYARGLHKKTWGGWSWDSLMEWGQYARYAIPGLLMLAFEWWSFEIGMFVVGSIGETELAINSVIMQVMTLAFMVPLSFRVASMIRVGNELGAGHPKQAKRVFLVTLVVVILESAFLCALLEATRGQIGKLFSSNQEVIDGVSEVLLYVAVLLSADHIQGGLAGVLYGCGKQVLGAFINFVCYYLFGLPLGIVLAIVLKLGPLGQWVGLLCGALACSIAFLIILFCTNWEKESQKAVKNSQATSSQKENSQNTHKGRDASELVEVSNAMEATNSHQEGEKEEDEAVEMETETTFLFTHQEEGEEEEEEEEGAVSPDAVFTSTASRQQLQGRESSHKCGRLKLVLYRLGLLAAAGLVLLGGVLARALVQPSSDDVLANCTREEVFCPPSPLPYPWPSQTPMHTPLS